MIVCMYEILLFLIENLLSDLQKRRRTGSDRQKNGTGSEPRRAPGSEQIRICDPDKNLLLKQLEFFVLNHVKFVSERYFFSVDICRIILHNKELPFVRKKQNKYLSL